MAKVSVPEPEGEKPQGPAEVGGAHTRAPLEVAVLGDPHSRKPLTRLKVALLAFAGSMWSA